MFIPFTNWHPDSDPVAPNLLTDPSNNIVPTERGYRGANSFLAVAGQTTITATCVGLFFARKTDNLNVMYAGTPTGMYTRSSGTWVSIASGATTISAVSRWQFAQWGNLTFAGALETQPMVTDTTTFTAIAAMPRYAIIDSVNEQIMLGNIATSVTYSNSFGTVTLSPGDHPDRWLCSGVGNPLTYYPSASTQAATGRLTDVAGKLTAGRALGDRFAFYKQRAVYIGEFVGNPFVWEWALISKEIGTFGQQCVMPVGNVHYFVGTDDFYMFDGVSVKPIGLGVRDWFFKRLNKKYADLIISVHDEYNKLVYWWYPGAGSQGALNEFIVLHYPTGKWGRGTSTLQAATSFFVDQLTWDQLWTGYAFNTIPNTSYDAAVFHAESYVPVLVDDLNRLVTLGGPQMDSTIHTNFGGDDTRASLLRRVRARWIKAPTDATLTPFRLMRQGESALPGTPRAIHNQRWDFTQNSRWHAVEINTEGNWEASGIDAEIVPRGKE